jgi:hypothetical protein
MIAKLWKQPDVLWPTTDEWIKKMCCAYIMEYCSAKMENEILLFAGK